MMHRRWEGWGRGLFASASSLGFLLVLSPGTALAQPFGIASRTSNSTLLIDSVPDETPSAMTPVRVFAPLTFNFPINMVEGYDGTNRMYVQEKRGQILVFDKDNPAAGSTVILNVQERVRNNGEMGFLGFALDPDYNNPASPNYGHFYVNYIWDPLGEDGNNSNNDQNQAGPTRISRFVNPDPTTNTLNQVPINSETVLLEFSQPATNHNGGWIGFGPDGMLYISSGDGGGGGDLWGTIGNGQNVNTLLGKMLRIDVKGPPDPGLNYRIPPDNPLVGVPNTRAEIWAWGLRNPWKASFDQLSGLLYAGDVGQGEWEEVDIILKSRNYGWRRMEGFACYNPASNCNGNPPGSYLDPTTGLPLVLPIQVYQHPGTQQGSITGGYVYYGTAVPELYGQYIYADYIDGRIWGLRYDGSTVTNTLLHDATFNIAAFAQDSTGEVYIMQVTAGAQIFVLRPSTPPPPPTGVVIPNQLSSVPGLFNAGKGIDQTNQGIVPYQPVAQLWSDGALKERFLALPGLTQMTYNPTIGWDMPNKTVIVKNFLLPLDDRDPVATAERIETRVLFKDAAATWHGFTYEWNSAGTEALLVASAGKQRAFTRISEAGATYAYNWLYPSRSQCFVCHTASENTVLGLNTAAINCELTYPASGVTDNQLRTLDHIAMFDAPLPDTPANLPRMEDPFGTAPVEARAKSYFAANCAMCHQPGGGAPGSQDVRWETAAGSMGVISAVPFNGLGLTNPRILYPGRPERSTMVSRVESLSSIRMPPLASTKVDPQGTQLIRDYLAWLGTNQDSDDDAFGDQYELDNAFDPFSGIGAPTLGDVDGATGYSVADVTEYHNFLDAHIPALTQPGNGDLTGDGLVTEADADRVADWLTGNVPVLR